MLKDDTVTILTLPLRVAGLRPYQATVPLRAVPTSLVSGHVPALDGIRGLAVLLVLVYHFTLNMTGQDFVTKAILKVTAAGWCGVDLFFVLSGFLITGILADTNGGPHRYRTFYARRALRIFPLYYFLLAAVFISLRWASGVFGPIEAFQGTWLWLILYAANALVVVRGGWYPLSHFWSLAVEEHFYLFWPAVIFELGRVAALRICIVLVVIALLLRFWLVAHGAVLAAYCLTPCRIDAIAIGAFMALAIRGPGGVHRTLAVLRRIGAASAAAIVVIAFTRNGLPFYDPVVQTVGYLCLDLLFASLILLSFTEEQDRHLKGFFESPPLRWLGRYSYGLYVYNSMFLLVAEGASLMPRLVAYTGSSVASQLFYILIASVSTLTAAWLSWHLLEKPILKLKRHFPTSPVAILAK